MLIILNIWMLLHYNLSCVHVHTEIGRSYLNVVLSCVTEGHRDGEPCTIRKDPCEGEPGGRKSSHKVTSASDICHGAGRKHMLVTQAWVFCYGIPSKPMYDANSY